MLIFLHLRFLYLCRFDGYFNICRTPIAGSTLPTTKHRNKLQLGLENSYNTDKEEDIENDDNHSWYRQKEYAVTCKLMHNDFGLKTRNVWICVRHSK